MVVAEHRGAATIPYKSLSPPVMTGSVHEHWAAFLELAKSWNCGFRLAFALIGLDHCLAYRNREVDMIELEETRRCTRCSLRVICSLSVSLMWRR